MKAGDEEQAMQPTGALRLEKHEGAAGRPGEREIAEAVRRGDHRAAISLCVRHHGEALGRLCMALLGSQADAEDLVQETFVDAFRGLSGWRGEGSVRAWLSAIARRKCVRQLERRGRQQAKLRLVSEAEAGADAEQLVELRRRAERARAMLQEIRPSEREALVLRFGAGLSYREVAEAFDIDEAAARKRVSRGIAAMRGRLHEEG
jgi:RNA polymerase sigma-70 factor (ECF subfamily)